jgi:ribonucleoside-diphosphate reductase alpha chain
MIKKLNDNSETILKHRYYVKDSEGNPDETWPELCERVVDSVVVPSCHQHDYKPQDILKFRASCRDMINNLDFLPNSPTLFNAGTKNQMLSACFIISIEDDLMKIYDSIKDSAKIHQHGGGVGGDFSNLRCKGSRISTTEGVSSGAVSFIQAFSGATQVIEAGGRRRGANMAILRIDHGDIEEFITCKTEEGKIHNFNISVAVTDKFMKAVDRDLKWDLIDPKDDKIVKTVKARDLLDKIVDGSWKNGEPGICFIDKVNEDNPTPHLGKIRSSNPCQPGWATVLTTAGIRKFSDIDIGSVVWSGKQWTVVINKTCSGEKPVYAYKTRAGIFYGTENHKIIQYGAKTPVSNASSIDISAGPDKRADDFYPPVVVDGMVLGDGTYHKASDKVCLVIGKDDSSYFDDSDISKYIVKHRPGIKNNYWEVETSFDSLLLTFNRRVPDKIRFGDNKTIRSFLRGLYTANGSVVSKRVTLKSASKGLIEDVLVMLSSIGISAYYTVNKKHSVKFNNGTYECKESYDLNIGTLFGRRLFYRSIGFVQPYKMEKLLKVCENNKKRKAPKKSFEIVEKEYIGIEPVYDITVKAKEHTYWTGGLLVSNCGEFFNIDYNSCNLGSINLLNFVLDGVFDYNRFKKVLKHATHFLDCIIDVCQYPIAKIEKTTKDTRPIGLGVFNFANTLIALNIRYGSKESYEFVENLAEVMSLTTLNESVRLSKVRGKYPEFRPENHLYEKYSFQSKSRKKSWKILVSNIKKYGLRNSHTMVQAPTGTLARIANEGSFGIEPLFALEFESHVLDGKPLIQRHNLYQEFLDGNLDVDDNVFISARDLSPDEHLNMQYWWQRWVHNGISKTVNLPNNATKEDVAEIYRKAWELGLKGVTVYREGSREIEVLVDMNSKIDRQQASSGRPSINIGEEELREYAEVKGCSIQKLSEVFECSESTIRRRLKEFDIQSYSKPVLMERPDVLESKTYKVKTALGSLYVSVGLDPISGRPMETVLNVGRGGQELSAMAEGLGRVVSKALQAHIDVSAIVKTLGGIGGEAIVWSGKQPVLSIPDAVANILSNYIGGGRSELNRIQAKIKSPISSKANFSCPDCGGKLQFQEGCYGCTCGYSKCG